MQRFEAARVLGRHGEQRALPALADTLTDAEPWVRLEAARALVRIGITKRQVKMIVRRLERTDPHLGFLLAEALGNLGPDAVPVLLKVLEDDESLGKTYAIMALYVAGRHGAPAVPKLVDLLKHESAAIRRQASEALRRLGPWAEEEVDLLLDRLEHGDEATQWTVILVLSSIGPAARDAIPRLRELLQKGPLRIRNAAAQALKRIDVARKQRKPHAALYDPKEATGRAPEAFSVRFETTRGNIDVEVKREWSPRGADRLFNLVKIGFYDDAAFFRVMKGFVAQFGLHGHPRVSVAWGEAAIDDDEVKVSNRAGWLTFARRGPKSRTTQLFFNLGNNDQLDKQGFSPVGRVLRGMEVVKALYSGYGETPSQETLRYEGTAYLKREFPNLDYIRRAVLLK